MILRELVRRWLSNWGFLVVGAGGSPTMFTFKQEEALEHPHNANILEALGIQAVSYVVNMLMFLIFRMILYRNQILNSLSMII